MAPTQEPERLLEELVPGERPVPAAGESHREERRERKSPERPTQTPQMWGARLPELREEPCLKVLPA